jgi:hypothetical protein
VPVDDPTEELWKIFQKYGAEDVLLIPTFHGHMKDFLTAYKNFEISYLVESNLVLLGEVFQCLFTEDLQLIVWQTLGIDIRSDVGCQIKVRLSSLAPEEREAGLCKLRSALYGHTGPYSGTRKYDVTTGRKPYGDKDLILATIHLNPWHCVAAAVGGSAVIKIGEGTSFDPTADILTIPLKKINWVLEYRRAEIKTMQAEWEATDVQTDASYTYTFPQINL